MPKSNQSKRPASSPTNVQRKVAKKPSTIASRGRGGSSAAGRSRQVPEPRHNSDSDASNDVLLDHHRRNGVPRAPDPTYLASLGNKTRTDRGTGRSSANQDADDIGVQSILSAASRSGGSKDPTTLKFYDAVWRAVLARAKTLSRFDAIINNTFPERQAYVSKRAVEFITQTVAEFQQDGVQPDDSIRKNHQHHMNDLVRLHSLRRSVR